MGYIITMAQKDTRYFAIQATKGKLTADDIRRAKMSDEDTMIVRIVAGGNKERPDLVADEVRMEILAQVLEPEPLTQDEQKQWDEDMRLMGEAERKARK